jgi:4-amino-4-deoxy-L-arabinose transferase-like glycosyltransferase
MEKPNDVYVSLKGRIVISGGKLLLAMVMLTLLLGIVSAFTGIHDTSASLMGDEIDYHRLAISMLRTHSYDSIVRPPVYPAFVALVYMVSGSRPPAVYFVQAILLAMTIPLIHRIALRITKSHRTSLLSCALCVPWFYFYQSVSQLMTEILSLFLVAVMVLLVMIAIEHPNLIRCIGAGVALAIVSLTKSVNLAYLLLLPGLMLVICRIHWPKRIMFAVTILIVAMISLSPWIVRNYRVTGCFVPVSTLSGFNLWYGNHPEAYKFARQGDFLAKYGPSIDIPCSKAGVEQDRILGHKAIAMMKHNPGQTMVLMVRKFSGFWFGSLGESLQSAAKPIPHIGDFGIPKKSLFCVSFFVLAIIGWFSLDASCKRNAYPIVLLLVLWSIAYIVLFALPRYAIPLQPYIAILASAGLMKLFNKHKERILDDVHLSSET